MTAICTEADYRQLTIRCITLVSQFQGDVSFQIVSMLEALGLCKGLKSGTVRRSKVSVGVLAKTSA